MAKDQIRFPSYIRSGMILQQECEFHLRGVAVPEVTVDIELERHPAEGESRAFAGHQFGVIHRDSTVCDKEGKFSFTLPALKHSFSPMSITVRCVPKANSEEKAYIRAPGRPRPLPELVVLDDILVGEVWVSGGQDNMVLPLAVADQGEYRSLLDKNDAVRFFLQDEEGKKEDEDYSYQAIERISNGRWTRAGQVIDLRQISAVAAWFAYDLNRRYRVPVGIVSTEANASLIHSWIDKDTLETSDVCKKHLLRIGLDRNEETWETGGDRARFQPAVFYNHKIAGLKDLTCRGFLWYQGESDVAFPDYYKEALPLMLKSWMKVFKTPKNDLPYFIYTQLAPYFYQSLKADALPKFNLMLSKLRLDLGVPSALIATHDLPLDFDKLPEDWKHPLHPQVKRPIGERMATSALGMVYRQKAPPSSPEVKQVKTVSNKLMLTFEHTFSNLRLRAQETVLRGFSIAGEDMCFHAANARLLYGIQVMLWHPDIKDPKYVQYAMRELNGDANLISEDNMSVLPFTTAPDGPVILFDPAQLNLDHLTIWAYPQLESKDPLPEQAAALSLYRAEKGVDVRYRLETANHLEGEAATAVRYKSDSPVFKILFLDTRYPSLRPKLKLSDYKRLTIRAFNMDAREKALALCGKGEFITLEAKLAWQTLSFAITKEMDGEEFFFICKDTHREGEIVFDQIELSV